MSKDAFAIDPDHAGSLSGTHLHALEKVFQHPLSHNLSWREVNKLFATIGSIEHRHNGDRVLNVGGEKLILEPEKGKNLDATDVMDIRHLLARAGWAAKPSNPETVAANTMVRGDRQ